MQDAIRLTNLSKRYGRSRSLAVDTLNLAVKPGEIYGFLGPNGAGKSTTIRIIMGLLRPSSGTVELSGRDIQSDDTHIHASVGYLAGDMALYPGLTGRQYLDYMSELLPPATKTYREQLIKDFNCNLHKKLGELSRGNKQKIGIVQAFMSQPQILILDEPTSGLDPLMQEQFYKLLRDVTTRGASVFMSSHVLSEVQKVCNRVGIVKEGKLVAERSIADLTKQAAQTFDITFAGAPPVGKLKRVKGLKIAQIDGNQVTLHLHGKLQDLLEILAGANVQKLDTHELDLEEMFMHFYGGATS